MATLQPYKKYNSVAYDYATELPDGWQLWKIAHAFNLIGSGTTPQSGNISFYESGTINWINTGDLNDGVINECKNKITELAFKKHSVLKIYPKGTLLVAMYGATIGKAAVMNLEGCTNQACCALSKSKILTNKFTLYWFIANRKNIVNLSYGGGQPNISQDVIKKLKIPVPPLEVQNSIVAYLDKKNSEIDKFIRNKEMLLELLEESRKRKIFDAITKGIDKDVDLKESGLPWIGIIPKHWELKKVKSFASHVQRGSSPTYVNESELVVISQASMSSGFIDETKYKYQSKAKIENFKGRLFEDDVLLASTGGGVLGKSIVFDRDGNYIADGHLTIIRDKKKRFNSKFLFYFLSINFDFIEGYLGQGSTNQTELQRGWFRDLYLPFPYLKEQDRIVEFVNDFNDEINLAISKAQKEISSIKEYREALITDLVTGKRSVQQV
jgi:type I restriction enzyme S subunit